MRSRFTIDEAQPLYRDDDIDPMASVANMADAMLVFACGLLISIVTLWKLDISSEGLQQLQREQIVEIDEDVEQMKNGIDNSSGGFEELGTVYTDPRTGKIYMLTDEKE